MTVRVTVLTMAELFASMNGGTNSFELKKQKPAGLTDSAGWDAPLP